MSNQASLTKAAPKRFICDVDGTLISVNEAGTRADSLTLDDPDHAVVNLPSPSGFLNHPGRRDTRKGSY